MADNEIENITKGIYEMLIRNTWLGIDDDRNRLQPILYDALKLLKEKKPKKPHYTTLKYIVNGEEVSVKHPECPRCIKNSGLYLWDAEIERGQAFCKRCGQAIDWSKDGESE